MVEQSAAARLKASMAVAVQPKARASVAARAVRAAAVLQAAVLQEVVAVAAAADAVDSFAWNKTPRRP